jgi:protein-disulfide isomerase
MLKIVLLLVSVGLIQCTKNDKESPKDLSRDVVQALGDNEVILEYNGGSISAKDVNEVLRPQMEQLRQQILASYVKAAEDLFAKRMQDKQPKGSELVSDEELEGYLKANNLPKADSEKIRTFLVTEKQRINKQVLVMQLSKDLNVKNRLTSIRYDVGVTANMPKMGKDSAGVTVQVFCDFGNPTCNRSRMALAQLKNEMGENVRWIYRHFPVASSPIGMQAALVAVCAQKQSKFWEVHDRFYDHQAELTNEKLVNEAVAAGADEASLASCLQSSATQGELDGEIRSAQLLGISSTPVYFVNGVRVTDIDQVFLQARQPASKKQ